MFIYKRKLDQKVLVGSIVVVAIKDVTDASGKRIPGAVVSLGMALPNGMRMQRGEQFLEDYDSTHNLPFPWFYRQVSRETGKILGYALTLPLEPLQSTVWEAINAYDDMVDEDHPISVFYFRSEAEVEAFQMGLQYFQMDIGASVTTKRDDLFLVLVDRYEYYEEPDINPRIRNITAIDPVVLRALKPERK